VGYACPPTAKTESVLHQFDVIVRVACATLLIVAAVALLRRGRRADHVWFAPFALCLCGYLAGNTTVEALQLSGWSGRVGVLLGGFVAVFLWWFCLAVFDWSFRPRGPVLALGLAWMVVASADRGVFGAGVAGRGLSWVLIVFGCLMMGHLAWRLYRDRDSDLLDRRRRSRLAVVVLLSGLLVVDMAIDVVLGLEWRSQTYAIGQNLACLAFVAWLLTLGGEGASAPRPFQPLPQRDETDALAARLHHLVEVEKIHLDPALDLAGFVRRMGAPEKTVRRLINHQLGHDHFRTFLNAWRMEEARRLLADPERWGDKLIVIAMDSGFASLSSFNRVFQSVQGMTPGAYRRALQQGEAGCEIRSPVAGF
jgi:AraC-like DNA-binding protein